MYNKTAHSIFAGLLLLNLVCFSPVHASNYDNEYNMTRKSRGIPTIYLLPALLTGGILTWLGKDVLYPRFMKRPNYRAEYQKAQARNKEMEAAYATLQQVNSSLQGENSTLQQQNNTLENQNSAFQEKLKITSQDLHTCTTFLQNGPQKNTPDDVIKNLLDLKKWLALSEAQNKKIEILEQACQDNAQTTVSLVNEMNEAIKKPSDATKATEQILEKVCKVSNAGVVLGDTSVEENSILKQRIKQEKEHLAQINQVIATYIDRVNTIEKDAKKVAQSLDDTTQAAFELEKSLFQYNPTKVETITQQFRAQCFSNTNKVDATIVPSSASNESPETPAQTDEDSVVDVVAEKTATVSSVDGTEHQDENPELSSDQQ